MARIEDDPDAGLALADDECFCVTPTVATNEHGETWCSVCGERLLLADGARIAARLDYLRGQIEAERISYGEIAELQSLAEYIDPSDVVLLQWAGVPESHG